MGFEFPDYREAVAAGAVIEAEDAAALATRIGVPPAALEATLAEARAFAAGEAADPFGRDFTTKPPLQGRLYAVRVTGALFHTQGGLAVDARARVLGADGRPLPNLFAGGGAACGVSGPRCEGYLSGNGLLTAISLGFIAGREAAPVGTGGARGRQGPR